MFWPPPWLNQVGNGLILGPRPDSSWSTSFEGAVYPQPDEVCQGDRCSNCAEKEGCKFDYFTNHTFIPGEPTLPDEMYDANNEAQIEDAKASGHPWSSPGTAPVFGEGCGANGGNPFGCQCQEVGTNGCYGTDDRPYGSCCAQVTHS